MFVYDTSAYINGWRDHLPPTTFRSVWAFIGDEMTAGSIVAPREVLTELLQKDDEVAAWANERRDLFVEPSEAVQRRAGVIYQDFPNPHIRDGADPFVIAEAEARGFTVVTYEGRSFNGVPTRRWDRQMPGVCQRHSVACATLPESLAQLGGSF
jgi:predicted nucleic acid-binding protein